MARPELVATLVSKGLDALLRRDFADARRIADVLDQQQHEPVRGNLLRAGAALAERLPPTRRAVRLATDLMTRGQPGRGMVARLCTSEPIREAMASVARSGEPVGLVGATRHTQWLLAATALGDADLRAVLLAQPPPDAPRFGGLGVHALADARSLGVTTLVVTTTDPDEKTEHAIARLRAEGLTVVAPLETVPPGLVVPAPTGQLVADPEAAGRGDSTLVAYLARHAEGVQPFEQFVRSYREHPAHGAHTLLVVFKGFPDERATAPYRERLAGLPHLHTFVDENVGFDLGAYFEVYRRYRFPRYLFLGSFCQLRGPGWLRHYERAYEQLPRGGLIGASGSWASGITYRFPNPHVRTSAFLIGADELAELRVDPIATKHDAHGVEHGLHGITRQALARGRSAAIIGLDGRAFPVPEWPRSHTYASGSQRQLLVSDNRTRIYERADLATRQVLAEDTWGVFAPPPVTD